jgi:hypothetical protein
MTKNTDWQVEYLRITVFPVDNTNISASQLWDQYIGEEPDAVNIQKGKLDTREVEYKSGRIVLIKQPDRIEWRYLAKPDGTDEVSFPIINNLEQELHVIVDLAKNWLDSGTIQAKRLAFGAVLLKPVESLVEGYEYLQEYLSFVNPNNLSEFDYRINRQRKSNVIDDLSINRLTRWNIASLNRLDFTINPILNIQSQPNSPTYATRLELDINTPANISDSLPTEELVRLFDELLTMGLELAEKGDIE